jgi:hypothetical protein
MKPILAIAFALFCLTPIAVHTGDSPSKDVSALLTPIIQKHHVPGIARTVGRQQTRSFAGLMIAACGDN